MKNILKRLYRQLPIIYELTQINSSMHYLKVLEATRLFDLDLKEHPRYGNPKRLLKYQYRVNSQNGEDGIIDEIIKRVGVNGKVFVEIGVGDGTENNTAFLLTKGWTGFWIDSNDFRKNIRKKHIIPENRLKGVVAFVNRENIKDIFSKLLIPKEFDILSIDVDLNTYYVWEGLEEYKPRIVIVEYNSLLPPDVNWKVNYDPNRIWDKSQNFGASLKAFELLGEKFDYCLVGCDFFGVNAFFVRKDLVKDLFEAPFTSENHYEPPRLSIGFNKFYRASLLD